MLTNLIKMEIHFSYIFGGAVLLIFVAGIVSVCSRIAKFLEEDKQAKKQAAIQQKQKAKMIHYATLKWINITTLHSFIDVWETRYYKNAGFNFHPKSPKIVAINGWTNIDSEKSAIFLTQSEAIFKEEKTNLNTLGIKYITKCMGLFDTSDRDGYLRLSSIGYVKKEPLEEVWREYNSDLIKNDAETLFYSIWVQPEWCDTDQYQKMLKHLGIATEITKKSENVDRVDLPMHSV